MRGCEVCPKNEDVWLEAARLQVREGGWEDEGRVGGREGGEEEGRGGGREGR